MFVCVRVCVCGCGCLRVGEGERSQRNHWICDKTSGDLTYSLTQETAVISLSLDDCFLPLGLPISLEASYISFVEYVQNLK